MFTLFSLLSHSSNYFRLCDASSTLLSYNGRRYITLIVLTNITYDPISVNDSKVFSFSSL